MCDDAEGALEVNQGIGILFLFADIDGLIEFDGKLADIDVQTTRYDIGAPRFGFSLCGAPIVYKCGIAEKTPPSSRKHAALIGLTLMNCNASCFDSSNSEDYHKDGNIYIVYELQFGLAF